MSPMVLRVAQRLCMADGLDWDAQADPLTSGNGDNNQIAYIAAAREVIEAMREPTPEMVPADSTDVEIRAWNRRETFNGLSAPRSVIHWRAMIDAALAEGAKS